jgi:hypothetical protein
MSYFLVAPGLDMSIELFLSDQLERAVALQWERLKDRDARDAFTRRIATQLEALLPDAIDWDIKEPTPAQISYAMAISKELSVAIPPDALRLRGEMHAFLEAHVPQARAKWGQKVAPGARPQV